MFRFFLAFVIVLSWSSASNAQTFSCSFGEPACLSYGDKVCPSHAKCVDSSAQCFDSHTCNYKGFVCKSTFDDVVDEHNEVVESYNELVDCVALATSIEEAQLCI